MSRCVLAYSAEFSDLDVLHLINLVSNNTFITISFFNYTLNRHPDNYYGKHLFMSLITFFKWFEICEEKESNIDENQKQNYFI